MGKVIVTIECEQLSTDNLETIVRYLVPTEAEYEREAHERYQFWPDVRVYVVPSDED